MSEEKTITENIVTKDGKTSRESITKITTYWNNMNPHYKKGIIVYGMATIGIFMWYNYTDGKNALAKIRQEKPLATREQEWKAVNEGIRGFSNFFSALFFPYTITSKIMPSVILVFNPK